MDVMGKRIQSLRIVDSDCGSEFLNAFKQNIAMGSNYIIFREMLIIGILKHKNSYLVEMIEGLFLNLTAHTHQEII